MFFQYDLTLACGIYYLTLDDNFYFLQLTKPLAN